MDTIAFDPTAPLPGPPDPWASTDTPPSARRPAVPHDRDDRRRAGAGRADRVPARWRPRTAVRRGWPRRSADTVRPAGRSCVTGCGTSEHGAIASGRDPARGARCARARRRSGARRRSSSPSTRRRPGSSSGSRTRAPPGRRTGAERRPGPPGHGPRSSPSATGRRARPSPTSSSRPRSWTRAGATRSATLSPIAVAAAVGGRLTRTGPRPRTIGPGARGGVG